MGTLPQLLEEDIQALDKILKEFLTGTDATAALVMDKGGFLITHRGDTSVFDVTTISALASGAYLANQTIANLVSETNFDSVYQQGDNFSMIRFALLAMALIMNFSESNFACMTPMGLLLWLAAIGHVRAYNVPRVIVPRNQQRGNATRHHRMEPRPRQAPAT